MPMLTPDYGIPKINYPRIKKKLQGEVDTLQPGQGVGYVTGEDTPVRVSGDPNAGGRMEYLPRLNAPINPRKQPAAPAMPTPAGFDPLLGNVPDIEPPRQPLRLEQDIMRSAPTYRDVHKKYGFLAGDNVRNSWYRAYAPNISYAKPFMTNKGFIYPDVADFNNVVSDIRKKYDEIRKQAEEELQASGKWGTSEGHKLLSDIDNRERDEAYQVGKIYRQEMQQPGYRRAQLGETSIERRNRLRDERNFGLKQQGLAQKQQAEQGRQSYKERVLALRQQGQDFAKQKWADIKDEHAARFEYDKKIKDAKLENDNTLLDLAKKREEARAKRDAKAMANIDSEIAQRQRNREHLDYMEQENTRKLQTAYLRDENDQLTKEFRQAQQDYAKLSPDEKAKTTLSKFTQERVDNLKNFIRNQRGQGNATQGGSNNNTPQPAQNTTPAPQTQAQSLEERLKQNPAKAAYVLNHPDILKFTTPEKLSELKKQYGVR